MGKSGQTNTIKKREIIQKFLEILPKFNGQVQHAIDKLRKEYKISRTTIYEWRKKSKKFAK